MCVHQLPAWLVPSEVIFSGSSGSACKSHHMVFRGIRRRILR